MIALIHAGMALGLLLVLCGASALVSLMACEEAARVYGRPAGWPMPSLEWAYPWALRTMLTGCATVLVCATITLGVAP